jgi:hypothetical protein
MSGTEGLLFNSAATNQTPFDLSTSGEPLKKEAYKSLNAQLANPLEVPVLPASVDGLANLMSQMSALPLLSTSPLSSAAPQAKGIDFLTGQNTQAQTLLGLSSDPLLASAVGLATPSESVLEQMREAAIARWAKVGIDDASLNELRGTAIQWGDLSNGVLGAKSAQGIVIDRDASGRGWFVDQTPLSDSEFSFDQALDVLVAGSTSSAFGKVDLLTALSHEMGHMLGLPDVVSSGGTSTLMSATLAIGVRRLPNVSDLIFRDQNHSSDLTELLQIAGGPTKVNTTSINELPVNDGESRQKVAVSGNGDYVVVWDGKSAISDGWDVYSQRYRADGSAVGTETRVNISTYSAQRESSIAMDGSGNYAILWYSGYQNGSGDDIYLRRFSANGQPLGDEVRVNSYIGSSQSNASIGMNAAGEFVVAWYGYYKPEDGSNQYEDIAVPDLARYSLISESYV